VAMWADLVRFALGPYNADWTVLFRIFNAG